MVVAEGMNLPLAFKEKRRGGSVGNLIGNAIATAANKEVRVSVLGHIQRGGSPTASTVSWLPALARRPSI
jgi:6-phosphofructokinase